MDYQTLRQQYHTIIYKSFDIVNDIKQIKVTYTYCLGKYTFTPSITIEKKNIQNQQIDDNFLNYLFFHYGLVNLINYYKLSCPKQILIEAGFLDDVQIAFFKKLIYNGLSEFFYRNHIDLSYETFTNFVVNNIHKPTFDITNFNPTGNLILVGGGKDSIVSLEVLKEEQPNNLCFLFERNIYPKNMPSYQSIATAGYHDDQIVIFNTEIDPLLLELNKKGFLNGHIPVSSQLAFASYIMAYLNNKKYIVVSNEASSNEGNIAGKNINHQYSKSFEFESDFREYVHNHFHLNIEYFSLLRPLLEIQIAKIFSHYPQYFHIFRSCNLSSKNKDSTWCCTCPKCLFIFIILSPYINYQELISIFGHDLLNDKSLLPTFLELLGISTNKPFECVGTFNEVQYACHKTIQEFIEKEQPLPYLLDYYKSQNFTNAEDLEHYFNPHHYIPKQYLDKLKKEMN